MANQWMQLTLDEAQAAQPATAAEQANFALAIGLQIRVGVPILECFRIAWDLTQNLSLRFLAQCWNTEIRNGGYLGFWEQQLSEIGPDETVFCAQAILPAFRTAIVTGEETGDIDSWLLQFAAEHGEVDTFQRWTGVSNEVIAFTRQMHERMVGGESFFDALQATINTTMSQDLREAAQQILQNVETGGAIDVAFRQHPSFFSNAYCNMIRAGVAGGALEIAFRNIVFDLPA